MNSQINQNIHTKEASKANSDGDSPTDHLGL